MKKAREFLICALLAASSGAAINAMLLLRMLRSTAAAIPGEIQATRAALTAEVDASRAGLISEVRKARQDLLARSERQVAAFRSETLAEVAEIRKTADRRVGDTLNRVDSAVGKIEEIRGDLRPVLVNTAALTADAKDSWDDLFWDVKGSVASATVAANQVAHASMEIRGTVPGFLKAWNGIGGNVQAITGNVDRLTRPHWYDRLLGYGLNGVVLYRNLNPATNLMVKGAEAVSARP